MKELGRILSKRRLMLGLAAIVLLNAFLFVREQIDRGMGLDLTLPQPTVFYFDGTVPETETADPVRAYGRYLDWLDIARGMDPGGAAEYLSGELETLRQRFNDSAATEEDKLDYAAVNSLLAQAEYIGGYDGWLAGIQENRDSMLSFSIFNDPDSFSGRNIVRTADEFQKLRGVELELGADGALESLLGFRISDYFLALMLLLTASAFLEERKAGLWGVVHAFPGGRLGLAVRRCLILLAASAADVAALHGACLAIGLWMYGGAGGLGRAVQSVEALGRLPELWTVGGFLVRFFVLRVLAAFLVALLLWLLLTAVRNVKYTVAAAGVFLAAEYSLYTFLPVQSAFNIFKYFNIFTYISLSDLFTNYLNIDMFGWPLGIRAISQAALAPLCLGLAGACCAAHCLKNPGEGRDLLGRAAGWLNGGVDAVLTRLGPLGMELWKTLWIQKGVVVLTLLIYAVAGLKYSAPLPFSMPEEAAARNYTAELSGPVDGELFRRIDGIAEELQATVDDYHEALEAYDRGEIEYPELDLKSRLSGEAETKLHGLESVEERAHQLEDDARARGFEPYLTDGTPVERVYGDRALSLRRSAAVLAVLALALILAGAGAYERQSGVMYLLRALPAGRGSLLSRKLALAAVMSAAIWAAVYLPEILELGRSLEFGGWAVDIQNFQIFESFPLVCPVWAFLAMLYVWRLLALMCGAAAVLAVSELASRVETACVAAVGAAVLPSLLNMYLGLDVLAPAAYVTSVEAASLLTSRQGAVGGMCLCAAALAALCGASAAVLWRRYVGRRR